MHRLVILGAGFGGLTVFHHVKKWTAQYGVQLTVISERTSFLVWPALPEVALGTKTVGDILFPLPPVIEGHGQLICGKVKKIDPDAQVLTFENGETISYDTLVLAMGAVKDFAAIQGFSEHGYSLCSDVLVNDLRDALARFDSGTIVIGEAAPSKETSAKEPNMATACEGIAMEIAFMIDSELRRRGTRHLTRIVCFTQAKRMMEDVGEAIQDVFEALMQEQQIDILVEKRLKEIKQNRVIFEDGTSVDATLSISFPRFLGPKVAADAGLADGAGFIPTNDDFRHLNYENIWAIGDIASQTIPKMGHLAVEQAHMVASLLEIQLTGKGQKYQYKPEMFCIVYMGPQKATLIRSDIPWGGNVAIAYPSSRFGHLLKTTLDEYMLRLEGKTPPPVTQHLVNAYMNLFGTK